jgi:hypothetical protein
VVTERAIAPSVRWSVVRRSSTGLKRGKN